MNFLLTLEPEEQVEAFYSLSTPRDVARLLEIKYGRLVYHLYKIADDQKYDVFTIPWIQLSSATDW